MKRFFLVILILAVAGGVWSYLNRDRFFPKPVAKEVAPQRWQVGDARTSRPGPPLESLNATNATDENATLDANATNATQAPPPADEIVGHDFVEDLSLYLVEHYLPAGIKKNPGTQARFDLNVKSVNIRYGIDFPGLNVNATDTLVSRRKIFDHVLQGPVLDFLHAAYTPLFLDSLDRVLAATVHVLPTGQSQTITLEQRAEMLGLLATRFEAIGRAVAILASNDAIRPLVARYLEDMDKVSQAHLAFWNLQADNASPAATAEAGTRIKTTIQTREISRQRLLQAIVGAGAPQGLDASELIYLAQWIHRRGLENAMSAAGVARAGDLLVRVAQAVRERAVQPGAEAEGEAAGNETVKVGE